MDINKLKEAWLLDDDILLLGHVERKLFRYIFIPNSKGAGFSYQYVRKKDLGILLFHDDSHIVYSGLGHLERVYN